MKLLYFLACLVVLIAAKTVAAADSCHLREVDLCVAIGLFQYQSNGVPGDAEKLNEWCESLQEVKDCMGNFTSKCLSPLQRELMGLMSGAEDIVKEFCTEGTETRAKFFTHSECLSEGSQGDEFKAIMKDLQVVIETLFDVPFKQRFPLVCCGANRWRKQVEDLAKTKCGDESVAMLISMVKSVVTDLPEIVCQQYDPSSEKCSTVLPPSGTPSKGAENNTQLGKLLDTVFGNL